MRQNNCPACHSIANFMVQDVFGRRFYQCSTSICHMSRDKKTMIVERVHFRACETVFLDNKVFNGVILYWSDGKEKTITVKRGVVID